MATDSTEKKPRPFVPARHERLVDPSGPSSSPDGWRPSDAVPVKAPPRRTSEESTDPSPERGEPDR